MSKRTYTAVVSLNYVFALCIALALAVTIGGIYFAQTKLSEYVRLANQKEVDADINEQNISHSKKTAAILAQRKGDVEKAKAIVANTKYYAYQDDIVRDLNTYASKAGVTVVGFNFSNSATAAAPAKNTAATPGLKTVSAEIRLASPLPYKNYLQFLRYIETNRTKMVVSQIEVQTSANNTSLVDAQLVSIEVYVR